MIKNNTADLISFLEKSVSPYHTTAEAIRLMDESGFTALEQNKPWKLEKGGNYYVKCFGTMLIADKPQILPKTLHFFSCAFSSLLQALAVRRCKKSGVFVKSAVFKQRTSSFLL